MGRMKDVYIRMVDEGYMGDPADYLKQVVAEYAKPVSKNSGILCPNCLKTELDKEENQINCSSCGQEYILVENSLRFK